MNSVFVVNDSGRVLEIQDAALRAKLLRTGFREAMPREIEQYKILLENSRGNVEAIRENRVKRKANRLQSIIAAECPNMSLELRGNVKVFCEGLAANYVGRAPVEEVPAPPSLDQRAPEGADGLPPSLPPSLPPVGPQTRFEESTGAKLPPLPPLPPSPGPVEAEAEGLGLDTTESEGEVQVDLSAMDETELEKLLTEYFNFDARNLTKQNIEDLAQERGVPIDGRKSRLNMLRDVAKHFATA
jgi:hypothetical protein